MSDDRIDVGDRVELHYLPNPDWSRCYIEGVVLRRAIEVGDCWEIKTDDGTLHCAQHFEAIIRRPLEEPDHE